MEAIADNQNRAPIGGPAKLITKQPVRQLTRPLLATRLTTLTPLSIEQKSEPALDYDNELSLRGGGMNLGFTCCDGACSFHKRCC